jgi:hypothetical protein
MPSQSSIRHRHLLIFAMLLTVALALAITWCLLPAERISQTNYDRINKGMTELEVKHILGDSDPGREFIGDDEFRPVFWTTPRRAAIWIHFAEENGVWVVAEKFSRFPTASERLTAWWEGNDPASFEAAP